LAWTSETSGKKWPSAKGNPVSSPADCGGAGEVGWAGSDFCAFRIDRWKNQRDRAMVRGVDMGNSGSANVLARLSGKSTDLS
jgi:hypothetical protein